MAHQLTVKRTELPFVLRMANRVAGMWLKVAPRAGRLDVDELFELAVKAEGGRLTDFGDPTFRGPMREVLGMAGTAGVCPLGLVSFRQVAVKQLVNRLRWTEYRKQHPEVDGIELKRPLFILGFPRTGTTLLQNLLTLEEEYRSLYFWELSSPTPVHPDPEIDRKKRVASVMRILQIAYAVAPEMAEVHEIRADTPEECWPLMANAFAAYNFDLANGLKGFGEVLYEHDMVHAYTEYKQQLQMMAHGREDQTYVLKCPEHLWFLDSLLEVFPDADIVWTHRDPASSIASYCSLVSMARRSFYGSVDPHELGAHIQMRFHEGVCRAMEARERFPNARIYDVDFAELVADPTAKVRDIRAHFGRENPEGTEARMEAWQNSGRKDKKGKHKYSSDFYGLDVDEIHEQYAEYISAFDIPIKGGRA